MALVVVGIAVAVFVTVRAGTDDAGPARPATAPTTALSGAAGELVRLLDNSAGMNFDVAYDVTEPGRGTTSAHLWRRPPLARLDTESAGAEGIRRVSALLTSSGPVRCEAQGSGPWSCAPQPDLNLGNVGVVPPTMAAQLSSLDVSVRDDRVLDEAVRCFTLSPRPSAAVTSQPGTGPAQLCLTSDGIPARVEAGPSRLELKALQRGRVPTRCSNHPRRSRARAAG